MEATAIISAVLKLGAALIPVLFFWLGYSRGKKAGYTKGVADERIETQKKVNELARKLYGNDDAHFGVSMPGTWSQAGEAGSTIRVESRAGDGTAWTEGTDTVPDDKGQGKNL